MRWRARAFLLTATFALASTLSLASRAHAFERTFLKSRFEPTLDGAGIGTVEAADVPTHLTWTAAFWLAYENDPLFINGTRDGLPVRVNTLVGNRLQSHIVLAMGLLNWAQLGIELPMLLNQVRDETRVPTIDSGAPLGSSGVGDATFSLKLRVLQQSTRLPFSLALLLPVSVPTGRHTDYFGEQTSTWSVGLLASRDFGPVRASANLLHRFRNERPLLGLARGGELLLRGGVAYRFDVVPERPTELGIAFTTAVGTLQTSSRPQPTFVQNPSELTLDLDHRAYGPMSAFFGVSGGVPPGLGVPDFRLFCGVRFAGQPRRAPEPNARSLEDARSP